MLKYSLRNTQQLKIQRIVYIYREFFSLKTPVSITIFDRQSLRAVPESNRQCLSFPIISSREARNTF